MPSRSDRTWLPFGFHQGIEYVFAVALGETSLHIHGPMGKVILGAGAYVGVLALLSRGPLGLVHIVGSRLHRILDLAIVPFLALSPIIARSDLDWSGVIVAEAFAIVLLRTALWTRYPARPISRASTPVPADSKGRQAVVEARSVVASSESEPEPRRPSAETVPPAADAGHPAGTGRPVPSTAWTLGVLAARAKRRGGGADRAMGEGARRLGAALGRAKRRNGS